MPSANPYSKAPRKKGRREEPALDWHVLMEGESGAILDLRDRYARTPFQRPVLITDGDTLNHWKTIETAMEGLRTWARNKRKALREVLLDDKETEAFLRAEGQPLPNLHINGDDEDMNKVLRQNGWIRNDCGYWDALELMELYHPLTTAGPTP